MFSLRCTEPITAKHLRMPTLMHAHCVPSTRNKIESEYHAFLHRLFTIYYIKNIYLLYLYLSICMCATCMQESVEFRGGIRSPRTAAILGCEPPCGCWESNLGPLREHPMLQTTESVLQSHIWFICIKGSVYLMIKGQPEGGLSLCRVSPGHSTTLWGLEAFICLASLPTALFRDGIPYCRPSWPRIPWTAAQAGLTLVAIPFPSFLWADIIILTHTSVSFFMDF